jgi:hypothetical protein
MTCQYKYDEHGNLLMVSCSRGSRRRCRCGRSAIKQCDYPLTGARAGETCSAHLCEQCAFSGGPPNIDYCGAHARIAARLASRATP